MKTLAAVIAGVLLGAISMLALQGSPHVAAPTPRPAIAASLPKLPQNVLLVWTPHALPAGLAERARPLPGVDAVTVVRGGDVRMTGSRDADGRAVDVPPPGYAVRLETIGVDTPSYSGFVPAAVRSTFASLQGGQVLLGATAARLRRLGAGGVLALEGGAVLRVAGVVDDAAIGGAEVVVTSAEALRLGVPRERYLLVSFSGRRRDVEDGIRTVLPAGTPVRFRTPGETPYLRHGDAVLPQVFVKERFGEFADHAGSGREIVIDPAWISDHVATRTIPLLGAVRCHRAILDALEAAMRELARRSLGYVVAGFDGCWNPRLVHEGEGVSRHAWGIAVDLNFGKNPTGTSSAQDRRLVEVMERAGFTWGGRWLMPDPAHFEYLRPARLSS